MSVQGVSRVAAGLCNVVLFSVVLGGAVGPAIEGSAQPVRLEPGEWYRVAPPVADEAVGTPAVRDAAPQFSKIEARDHGTRPIGMTAWLVVAGFLLIPAVGLFRQALFGPKSSFGGRLVAPSFSPRGAKKECLK